MTVITDSVGGVLLWEPGANKILSDGFDLDVEAVVCRKLAKPGCGFADPSPPSALDTVLELGPKLGKIVVIVAGYNDTTPEVAEAIDPLMRALTSAGVEHVIWVTYVEHLSEWTDSNAVLVTATARWPQLMLADWNAVALQHDDWFVDQAHMDSYGAQALARFLHPFLVYACGAACVPPPPAYCGLARTTNGFDYVRAAGIECPAALGSVVSIERNERGPWGCSRNVDGTIELTCVDGDRRIELLERSPVPATHRGGVVTLSNWSFRVSGRLMQGRRDGSARWLSLGRAPWCIPDVPREVLVALGLKPLTANGGCFS